MTASSNSTAGRGDGRRGHPWLRVLGVLVLVGVVVGGALLVPGTVTTRVEGTTTASAAERAPLQDVVLACPESRYVDGESTTDVGAIALPGQLAAADRPGGTSKLSWTGLGRRGELDGGTQRQRLSRHEIRGTKTPPMVLEATGDLAPGIAAGQLTRGTEGQLRGLAESACTKPGTRFWFAGTGSDLGRHGQLHLTNVDATPARVDLAVHDESGRVKADETRGMLVQPFTQRVVELSELAPTSKRLAVGVTAVEGRVSAALRDDIADAGVSRGVGWLPQATPPAKDVLVPGVAPGKGKRVLTVAAPKDSSALVNLKLLGANSTFTPTGNATLEVPPGTVREVDLGEATSGDATAVRLTSDAPVVAGVRSEIPGSGDPETTPSDFVHSAAAEPLSGSAVVPMTEAGDDTKASLLLSAAGKGTARARVTMLGEDGKQLSRQQVKVKVGSTVEHQLKPPSGIDRYALLVEPAKGAELYGTRLVTEDSDDGALASAWQLTTTPTTYIRPAVRSDPAAGL